MEDDETQILRERFAEALTTLKKIRKRTFGRRYLYELPWYIIIGPPGSGKTTALTHSGLEFPLSKTVGNSVIPGVGGTRHCDWWFSNDAVLLDTAGRYTTQDSDKKRDQSAWNSFLALLKEHRKRRPINGVLLTFSLADLMQQSSEERLLQAQAIRERINELYDAFGIRFPIYILLTKADLIAGFNEFFETFTQQERAQVWGETFSYGDHSGSTSLNFSPLNFSKGFDEIIERLKQQTITRLQQESDPYRRLLIHRFPQQMGALQQNISDFLNEVFQESRYHQHPLLRGIYFTSGTQEGTPIDRLMGNLAETFGLDRHVVPNYSGHGKSFFIKNLFPQIILPEASIAGTNPHTEQRRRWLQNSIYVSALGLGIASITGWMTSFTSNELHIQKIREQVSQYHQAVKPTPPESSDSSMLLDELDTLGSIGGIYPPHPPWQMKLGLYQGEKLNAAAADAYLHTLRSRLPVTLHNRIAQLIEENLSGEIEVLQELLLLYLMLGDPTHLDKEYFKRWVTADWKLRYSNQETTQRLGIHLDNLLLHGFAPYPVHEELIHQAQASITKIPLYKQVYARLKNETSSDHSLDFRVADILGSHGPQIFKSRSGLNNLEISGLFTRQGFEQFYLKRSPSLIKEMVQQWSVINRDEKIDSELIKKQVLALYSSEYINHWKNIIHALDIVEFTDTGHAAAVLSELSLPENPLHNLLLAIETHTSLRAAASGLSNNLLNAADASGLIPSPQGAVFPGSKIAKSFALFHTLIRGKEKSTKPFEKINLQFRELNNLLQKITLSTSPSATALNIAKERYSRDQADIITQIRTHSSTTPSQLQKWLNKIAVGSWSAILSDAKKSLNRRWSSGVYPLYQQAFSLRYPLYPDSQEETTLIDFGHFFSPKGLINGYFEEHIQPFVSMQRDRWSMRELDGVSLDISKQALEQFKRAATIRDTFFQGRGEYPTVQFGLKPSYLDETVSIFTLKLDGQTVVYRHGPTRVTRLQWPGTGSTGASQIVFKPINGSALSSSTLEGPWAWFRLLDSAKVYRTNLADHFTIIFNENSYESRYELHADSVTNPFRLSDLSQFRCPETL